MDYPCTSSNLGDTPRTSSRKLALGLPRLIQFIKRSFQHRRISRCSRKVISAWSRFQRAGKRKDLDSAITFQEAALVYCPPPDRDDALHTLAFLVNIRYERWHEVGDLERAIDLNRAALELRQEGHPSRPSSLDNLAGCLCARFSRNGTMEGLEEAISLLRTASEFRTEDDPERSLTLGNLAISLGMRFQHGRKTEDLEEAILLDRAVLELIPEDDPHRSSSLSNLSSSLRTRFEHDERMEDIAESISLQRSALELRPEDHLERSLSLSNLAQSLRIRFQHCGKSEDLEESILLDRAALELRPEGHPDRFTSLGRLANGLGTRFRQSGVMKDLEEAISLEREALVLRPDDHPDRANTLTNLASWLGTRFEHTGTIGDLEEAVSLGRAALELPSEDLSHRSILSGNLASWLRTRFTHIGRAEDLEEAISLQRATLESPPKGHREHSFLLSNLVLGLLTRFEHGGGIEDLEEAISLDRVALELRPEGDPERPSSLVNLANALLTRFERSARREDLDETISLQCAALELQSKGHPQRSDTLSSLSSALAMRFRRDGTIEDLDEAISLGRDALELRPEGHSERYIPLSNLASWLGMRSEHSKKTEDVEEAISLGRAALEILPKGHIDQALTIGNLSNCLQMRFRENGTMRDLEESISLQRVALELRPEGHPDRSMCLENLAEFLYDRFEKEKCETDLEESVQSFSRAASHPFSNFSDRLDSVGRWATIARLHDHNSLLEAHRTALSLLQRALTIRPTLAEQHNFLSSDSDYQSLALDAAADAIGKGKFALAVEFLEQGRALLWTQMRGFRTPLEQLAEVDGKLAERFGVCNRRLEALITFSKSRTTKSKASVSGSPEHSASLKRKERSIDEALVQMRRLSEEQETIINDIRRIPGFEHFLEASPFGATQEAAMEGPVIVLNHSEHRCDVLIVCARETDPCVCVPLDKDFYTDAINLHEEFIRIRKKPGVGSGEYDEVLRRVMKVLWDRVVSKVVQKLKELGVDEGSRIWWCPTSVLSAFPFHAAGPYKGADGREKYLLDEYISSYTPTLVSLINARSGAQNGGEKMLFVGDTKLPSAKKERDAIIRIRRFKQLMGERATPQAVLKLLQEAQWVHFACHGILAKEPFNSSLKLHGGKITLLDIARASLPNAEFAFLSACHTAEQGPDFALDEALHLAAGMQFCGFRSVVGTMWQLLDYDGPLLSGAVYRYLMRDLEEGEIRFKRAAAAVRLAALNLREHGEVDPKTGKLMTERWVNLVHIGA